MCWCAAEGFGPSLLESLGTTSACCIQHRNVRRSRDLLKACTLARVASVGRDGSHVGKSCSGGDGFGGATSSAPLPLRMLPLSRLPLRPLISLLLRANFHRQTDRQTDRQTGRQTGRQTERE